MFGAFSLGTVRGLLYIQTRRFITISLSVTQAPLASLPKKEKPLEQQRPSPVGLQAVPTDDVHPLPHLQLPCLVALSNTL